MDRRLAIEAIIASKTSQVMYFAAFSFVLAQLGACGATLHDTHATEPDDVLLVRAEGQAWFMRGELSFANKRYADAIYAYSQAYRSIEPRSDLVLARLIGALSVAGHETEARHLAYQAISDRSRSPRLWLALGEVEERAKRLSAAIGAFERVIQLDAKNIAAAFALARIWGGQGQYQRGQKVLWNLLQDPRTAKSIVARRLLEIAVKSCLLDGAAVALAVLERTQLGARQIISQFAERATDQHCKALGLLLSEHIPMEKFAATKVDVLMRLGEAERAKYLVEHTGVVELGGFEHAARLHHCVGSDVHALSMARLVARGEGTVRAHLTHATIATDLGRVDEALLALAHVPYGTSVFAEACVLAQTLKTKIAVPLPAQFAQCSLVR